MPESSEADELARELAKVRGRSITDVVIESLKESLARESGRTKPRSLKEELREIGKRCASLPVLDPRSPDEIIGYDDIGVPR
jgi:antitoxin VapB